MMRSIDSGSHSAMYLMPSMNSSSARGSLLDSHSSGKYFSASRVTRSSISTCVALLDFLVLEHFTQRAAVAAADDHDALGARVREQRRVGHHLVVEEVVARGDHHAAVDHHQLAPVGRLVDLDRLERRLLGMQSAP